MRTEPPPYGGSDAAGVYGGDAVPLMLVGGRRTEHFAYARLIEKELDRVPHGRRLLDFGCGPGYMLEYLLERGYDAYGCEINPFLADLASERSGGRVVLGPGERVAARHGPFDVLFANHVLEHIPDPVAMMSDWRTLLVPGGVMAIALPNAASLDSYLLGPLWNGLQLRTHLWHFEMETLRATLVRAGVTPLRLVLRSTVGTTFDTHRGRTLLSRAYLRWVAPVGEKIGKGGQIVAIARS